VKKRSPPHILADEHFKEVFDAPWHDKIGANPASRGNAAIPPEAD
jgi:hypothetical protein